MNRPRSTPLPPSFEELSCYLDGELAPERLEDIDRWLADHPEALQELLKIRTVEKDLRIAIRRRQTDGKPKA